MDRGDVSSPQRHWPLLPRPFLHHCGKRGSHPEHVPRTSTGWESGCWLKGWPPHRAPPHHPSHLPPEQTNEGFLPSACHRSSQPRALKLIPWRKQPCTWGWALTRVGAVSLENNIITAPPEPGLVSGGTCPGKGLGRAVWQITG